MPYTLRVQSFPRINTRERTALASAADAADTSLTVDNTAGLSANDVIYVGTPGQEQCEKATIDSVDTNTALTLKAGLKYAHEAFSPVLAVLGDSIHIYRAANADGSVPADGSFTVLATRDIKPDGVTTYYTDSSGSSSYWYRFAYYNAVSEAETSLSEPFRGEDYGHYATLDEIRTKAGFQNARNLPDALIDPQRRDAETEINTKLGNAFNVPFTSPVPDMIHTLTIRLAAGFLLLSQYGADYPEGKTLVADARADIMALANRSASLPELPGGAEDGGVTGFPDDETDSQRMFTVQDVW